MYDVLIIGGGVIGCAVAHRLSEYRGHMAVVEAGPDVCQGASRALLAPAVEGIQDSLD